MATVTFYKAPIINETNRFRRTKIAAYLATCASVSYDTGDAEVQPNVPFFVKKFFTGIQDAAQYNYIGYTNAGVQCYALILDVSQVSSNLSEGLLFKIFHVIDVISTYGDGIFDDINGVYASGIMSRGHVNDWAYDKEKAESVPINKYYLAAPEETVNNANIRYTRFTPDLKFSPATIDVTELDEMDGTFSNYEYTLKIIGYLIVYISNASAVIPNNWWEGAELDGSVEISTLNGDDFMLPAQGLPCIFGVGIPENSDTAYGVYCARGVNRAFRIGGLKNSNITSMCFLPLIWDPAKIMVFDAFVFDTESTEAKGGFPAALKVYPHFKQKVSFADDLKELSVYMSGTTGTDVYERSKFQYYGWTGTYVMYGDVTYKSYVTYMYAKTHTAPYFNLQIEDTSIISLFWSADYEYQCALDCSGFLVYCNWGNTANDYSIISTTNLGMFAPAVVNDYWTRLNATQESILATINQTQNVMGVASSTVNFVTQGAAGVAGAATGGMTAAGAAGAGGGIAGAGTGLIGSIATYGEKKEYYSNQQELAERQVRVGETRDVAVMGILQLQDSYVVPAVKCQYLTEDELYRLGDLIHKKGYVTNMPITNVTEHARTCFNYVQCTDYNIGGLPISVTRELQDLYARGLWLWHDASYDDNRSAGLDGARDIYGQYFNYIVSLETL